MKKYLILLLSWSVITSCQNKPDGLPDLKGSVNDYENLFSPPEQMMLAEAIESYYEENGIGITIVTVESIAPYNSIFKYSLDLAIAHNKGQVLIVVSRKLHQIQIQNVDSIRDKLTDAETKNIIDSIMIPKFKEGDYFKGVLNGVMEIKKELN